jgi:hypothetical protein
MAFGVATSGDLVGVEMGAGEETDKGLAGCEAVGNGSVSGAGTNAVGGRGLAEQFVRKRLAKQKRTKMRFIYRIPHTRTVPSAPPVIK